MAAEGCRDQRGLHLQPQAGQRLSPAPLKMHNTAAVCATAWAAANHTDTHLAHDLNHAKQREVAHQLEG